MDYQTPMSRVLGLGTAREGAGHWWSQRVSSIALVPLTLLAILPLGWAIGAGREAVLATYANPFNALVMALLIGVTFRHLQQGLQVVIEDYVHNRLWRTSLLLANAGFCWVVGLAGVFGVARIALGA